MGNMKMGIAGLIVFFLGVLPAKADTVWDYGHHEINIGDMYGEIWMHNDATADMFGGYVQQLGTLDSSEFDMFGGTIYRMLIRYDSSVNIHGGTISSLIIYEDENGVINLYAHDVTYYPTGGPVYNLSWIDGYYNQGNIYFSYDISGSDMSNINVVPEPTTILLLGLGGLILRKK